MVKDLQKMTSSKTTSDILIIIPAYNEEGAIGDVIKSLHSLHFNVLVVNDGSTDQTAVIAKLAGATVISHELNRGYEGALESGFEYARRNNFKYLITFDADGQHNPLNLEKIIEALRSGYEIVVGVRPKFQRVSENLFSIFTKYLWGIKDPLCGLKGYSTRLINQCDRFNTYKSVGTELMLRIVKSGLPIKNIEIDIRQRKGKAKFGTGLRPNLRIVKALIMGLFRAKSF